MAALQSRATQRRQQVPEEEDDNTQEGHVINAGAPRRAAGRRPSQRTPGVALEQESWILFAPKQPAQPVLSRGDRSTGAIDVQDEEQIDPDSPFSTSLASDSTLTDRHGDAWQLVGSDDGSPNVATATHPIVQREQSPSASDRNSTEAADIAVAQPVSPFPWSSIPRHDSSYFFDDDDQVAADNTSEPLQSSIYPSVEGAGSLSSRRSRRDCEETDLLSIPSSLSVSERSTSSDAASPRSRSAKSFSPVRRRYRNTSTLTEAALEEASRAAEANEQEAVMTSDSEGEVDGTGDADEDLLSRTPDAMSAGIRAQRRRQPLAAIVKPPSQAGFSVRSSSSQKSGTKRRHRVAGMSDKGSKRSNTSGSAVAAAPVRREKGKQSGHLQMGAATSAEPGMSVNKARFSFGQAARNIFAVDEEVLEMMAQPGSIFSQALPPGYTARGRKAANAHGLQALSGHLQSELGDCAGTRYLFTASDEDEEMASGNDTETEQTSSRHLSSRIPFLRYSIEGEEEDPHTASLGLHRSFSLAGLQHFLVDSIYGSLPSSFIRGGSSVELGDTDTLQRKRTRSHPGGIERSHSSSELRENTGAQADVVGEVGMEDYSQAVSYWRRVLRSLAM